MTSGAIVIPHGKLEPDTLRAVIEEFICREGTDYGEYEVSLETKVIQVHKQLIEGRAVIMFDPETESCTIVEKQKVVL